MPRVISAILWLASRPGRVGGPILHKELRVASRRRRCYLLRFAYVALLTAFAAMAWADAFGGWDPAWSVRDVTLMAEVGKSVVSKIVWFQFCTAPLIAMVMLSRAVSDEIYRGTLAMLMTTPLSGWQIVLGKLLGGLWQVLVLLAASVPLLALLRVFGGVPTGYVLAGTCLTVSSVILVASISLRQSVRNRPMYRSLFRTLLVIGFLTCLLPCALQVILLPMWPLGPPARLSSVAVYCCNPAFALWTETERMLSPGVTAPGVWQVTCLIALGWAAVFLWRAARAVRKAALAQIGGTAAGRTGGAKPLSPLPDAPPPLLFPPVAPDGPLPDQAPRGPAAGARGRIRRVRGSPIIWKDLRESVFRNRRMALAAWGIILCGLAWTYFVSHTCDLLDNPVIQGMYVFFFVLLGGVATAVMSVKTMTAERESHCWPLLLCTPMSDARIAVSKAAAVFVRCLPFWAMLVLHVVLFSIVGYLHPLAIVHAALLGLQLVVFFSAVGLYVGSVLRRTGTAVPLTVAVVAVLWWAGPAVLAGLAHDRAPPGSPPPALMTLNPTLQAVLFVDGAAGLGAGETPAYAWPELRRWPPYGPGRFTALMGITTSFYLALGAVFVGLTVRRLRRRIFG